MLEDDENKILEYKSLLFELLLVHDSVLLENDVDSSNDSEKCGYLIKSRENSPKKYISDEQYFNDDNLMNVPIFKLRGKYFHY